MWILEESVYLSSYKNELGQENQSNINVHSFVFFSIPVFINSSITVRVFLNNLVSM